MGRPRAGIRLRKRPDNDFYEVVGYHPTTGEKIRLQCGTRDEVAAQVFLDQFVAGLATVAVMAPVASRLTVAQLMTSYEADRLPDVSNKAVLKQSCNHIRRHLGNLELPHINSKTIAAYAECRRRDEWVIPGTNRRFIGVSDTTITRELRNFRAALKWAWDGDREGWYASRGMPTFSMPTETQSARRERWLTKPEAIKLIEHSAPHIALFIMIALETAARKEAIEALRWDMIDWQNHIIDFGPGRGKKRRPSVEVSVDLINELRATFEARTTDRVIEWGGASGKGKDSPDSKRGAIDTKKGLQRAAIRAEFVTGEDIDKSGHIRKITDVTAHILKHTAITWMIRGGMSYDDVAHRAETTAEMIRKHYGKHEPKLNKAAREALGFLHMRKQA